MAEYGYNPNSDLLLNYTTDDPLVPMGTVDGEPLLMVGGELLPSPIPALIITSDHSFVHYINRVLISGA